jgi:hypothetical protein
LFGSAGAIVYGLYRVLVSDVSVHLGDKR